MRDARPSHSALIAARFDLPPGMTEPVRKTAGGTDLHRGERVALREYLPFDSFEPLSKHPRVGLASMHSLAAKGLVTQGPTGIYG